MRFRIKTLLLIACLIGIFSGCAKKADIKIPLEKLQKQVSTMSLSALEARASDYAAAMRAERAEIGKIQLQMRKMPVNKIFNNKNLNRRIAEIGREGEALFERYQICARAYQDKGGNLDKIRIEPVAERGKL